jgi:hypothetical protein
MRTVPTGRSGNAASLTRRHNAGFHLYCRTGGIGEEGGGDRVAKDRIDIYNIKELNNQISHNSINIENGHEIRKANRKI